MIESPMKLAAIADARRSSRAVRAATSELGSIRKRFAQSLVRANALGASVRELGEETGLTYGRVAQIIQEETRFPGE